MSGAVSFDVAGWHASGDEFTTVRVRTVGQAMAGFLSDFGLTDVPVGVSYDTRLRSTAAARALCEVLNDNGFDVARTAQDRPLPVLAWLVRTDGLSAGVMVTGSGSPPDHNGVKVVTAAGAPPLPPMIDALSARIDAPRFVPAGASATTLEVPVYEAYAHDVRALVDSASISGVSVVYDGMHGTGRGIVPQLLRSTGAGVDARRCTRDPTFRTHPPSLAPAHLAPLRQAVESTGVDLGLANDGDADRIAVVSPERGRIPDDLLFAAVGEYLLEERPGPIVRDVAGTALIDRIAAEKGETVIETSVGFPWIAAAMREHDAILGADGDGGYAIGGHLRTRDGVAMSLVTTAMTAAEPLDRRIDRLLDAHGPVVRGVTHVSRPAQDRAGVVSDLAATAPESLAGRPIVEISGIDGYRFALDDGAWVLLRPGDADATVDIHAEASTEDAVEELIDASRELVTNPA